MHGSERICFNSYVSDENSTGTGKDKKNGTTSNHFLNIELEIKRRKTEGKTAAYLTYELSSV